MSDFAAQRIRVGGKPSILTFIPIRSEGAKRRLYQCEACWKMVRGTEYDQHERLCTKCLDAMREPLKPRGFVEMLKALFRRKEAGAG